MSQKNKITLFIIALFFIVGYFSTPAIKQKYAIIKATNAAGGFPYQIGLTNVIVAPCVFIPEPPKCVVGPLCMTLSDPAICNMHAEVFGTPAGGMGNNALFLKTSLATAGVTSGGQLIAGGISNVLMSSGVLGGPTGCVGCVATKESERNFVLLEIFNNLKTYFIASYLK